MKRKQKKVNNNSKKKIFSVFHFNKMKLAEKTAVIISAMLTIIFIVLISFTVLSAQKSTGNAIAEEFNAISKSNGIQVQNIVDEATNVTKSMENYLVKSYRLMSVGKQDMTGKKIAQPTISEKNNEGEGNPTPLDNATNMSSIYNSKITELNSDVEKYITETAKNTVIDNPDIIGMGVMLEPYSFDPNIEDYAFYINKSNANSEIKPYGKHSEYSKEEYYTKAAQEKQLIFTEPHECDGITIITVASPIIYYNKLMGVIMVDINVTNFAKIDSKNELYPSMFAVVYDDNGTIIYDSEANENTGKNLSEFYTNEEQLANVQSLLAKGEAFCVETSIIDGRTVTRFFNPIKAGNVNWWTLTALNKEDMNKSVRKITFSMLGMSILFLIIIVATVIVVLKRMLNPIQDVVKAAETIAKGNFDVTLKAKSNDEIGMLARTFDNTSKFLKTIIEDISYVLDNIANKNLDVHTSAEYVGDTVQIKDSMDNIIASLNEVISNINQSSDQVADGTEQVSGGAQALSQGATEQASSIEELSASIEEISGQVTKNAENARNANKESTIAADEIHESNLQMQEMIKAIDRISDKSGEIGKIIKTIDGIAFQTNILALNAAVEAARAGAAGKGFAVVADEVRNLASKSAEAAKNTTVLIDDTIKAVESGTEIANKTANSMLNVVDSAKKVTYLVDEIAQASSEQATSIEQITQGVEQISGVVQTNSATAEESAAASEELSSQAQILKDMVGQFKLKNEENSFAE